VLRSKLGVLMGQRRQILVAAAILLSASAIFAIRAGARQSAAPAGGSAALEKEWPSVGGDAGDTHFSPLTQIDTRNVKTLGAAWISKRFEDGATSRVTPVVKDGMMFVSAGTRVYALNAATGDTVWTYQTTSGPAPNTLDLVGYAKSPNALPNNEGVAVGGGKVYVGVTAGRVLALDEKTGHLDWTADVNDQAPVDYGRQISSAPVYSDGIVFCGITSPELLLGQALALDAKDGHELWRFHTIPGPGEPGHETWPNSDTWKMGGGNVWLPAAVDPELGLVFYGTGSADPLNGGEVRVGDNLYTNSVLALDIRTGKLRWYYQVVHHDIWDTDIAIPVVLFDLTVNGQLRKGVAAMRPDGILFLLDRATGKPLIPIKEQPVPQDSVNHTAPTQPFPVGVKSILADCSEWKEKIPAGFVLDCSWFAPTRANPPNVLAPAMGGVRVQPMSFDPQTGYFYSQGTAALQSRRRAEDPYFWLNGGGRAPGFNRDSYGVLAAVDGRNGQVIWKVKMPAAAPFGSGGVLSTAGGLVFHRRGDGNIDAYNATNGDPLWKFQTGYIGSPATPVSYEVGGKQYIALAEGPEIWAFALGGAIPQRPAPSLPGRDDEFVGPIKDTTVIAAVSLDVQNMFSEGEHFYADEYSFNPYRARVAAGTPVKFVNNGRVPHTFAALDGSWSTPSLLPYETAKITFSKPGKYTFICKDHPWSYGELIVVEASAQNGSGGAAAGGALGGGGFAAQASRGQVAYAQSCSSCHMADLSGNGQAAPPLVGPDFLAHWQGRTAADLFGKTRTTMPTGNPGSLSRETYVDLVAYLLQANEFHPGAPLAEDSLANLPLDKK